MSENNGLATSDDFRKAVEFDPPERVRLPKLGKDVMLRRPRTMWFLTHDELALSLSGQLASDDQKQKREARRESVRWMLEVIQTVMVHPRCSLTPKEGEISPDLLDMEDANFIVKWAYGEIITREGQEAKSLDTFREVGKPVGVGTPQ